MQLFKYHQVVLSLLSCDRSNASPNPLQRRAALEVIAPNFGDTIAAGSDFDILWKNATNKNVTISLRQGSPENMTLVHVISASTPNNGTYAWRSNDDKYLDGLLSTNRPTSNCDYAMEFRTEGQTINSNYFTVLNVQDGGIGSNSTCFEGGPAMIQSLSTSADSNTNSSSKSKGVSTATLGAAIGGTVAGMLFLMGLLGFWAKKRGSIISRRDVVILVEERIRREESKTLFHYPERAERSVVQHGDPSEEIVQTQGTQIHQMP